MERFELTWSDVESSTILQVRFTCNETRTGKLVVRFKASSDVYIYDDVPINKVFQFMVSSSPGSFFAKEIKNSYKYTKL